MNAPHPSPVSTPISTHVSPNLTRFYIDGAWVEPSGDERIAVIDPATETAFAEIAAGTSADVDLAVAAARRAFDSFSITSVQARIDLLNAILAVYDRRAGELAAAVTREMGAPKKLSVRAQVGMGRAHLATMVALLKDFPFHEQRGSTMIAREAVGVVAMITPWNWPLNQIACKVAPALGAGCTMVLKPSEEAPLSAVLFAEILHEAGVPKGVFNLVQGTGQAVGQALSTHRDVDMVSFTGSTRAGIAVAKAASETVKRVQQELGGKSPNIILADADLQKAVSAGVMACLMNSGQSCNAPTRMFVPAERAEEAYAIAAATAGSVKVGPPDADDTVLGPVVNRSQFDKIQGLIETGVKEGAQLLCGGPGRPTGLDHGFYVQPTVFGGVTPDMTIAREEIFGPVLAILLYASEEEAIAMANDTPYGLAGYVQGGDMAHVRAVARRLRAGTITVNGAGLDTGAPFGGYKQSGNGREWGEWGLHDFLEVKGVIGWGAAA